MKTDKDIFIRNFAEFTAWLPDELDLNTVWDALRKRGNTMIRHNRRYGEIEAKRALRRTDIPIHIDGVDYRTSGQAGKALGLDRNIVGHRLASPHFPTWVHDRIKKRINGTQLDHYGRKALIVIIDGVEYPSITAAGLALGLSAGAVYHRLHSKKFIEWTIK